MDWAQILVIILSVFLALFLLIGIVLGIMLVRLTRQIRTVAAVAERAALTVEKTVRSAHVAAVPAMILGKVMKYMKKEKHHGGK